MTIKDYVDEIFSLELEEIKDKTLTDIIAKFHAKNLLKLYILKNKKPIFVLTPKEIVDIFLKNLQNINAYEFFKDKDYIQCLNTNEHIIDAYYKMRKENLSYIPVCEDNEIIGELDFHTFSLKITYFVIKDELSGVYNRKYFDVLIEEYNEFNKSIGLICLEIKDLPIYEGIYGIEMVHSIIKSFSKEIVNSVRSIDFVFRWDNQFRIIVFNNIEVTAKILERINNRLKNLEINGIRIPFKICMTHTLEYDNDLLMSIEECEKRLIERD